VVLAEIDSCWPSEVPIAFMSTADVGVQQGPLHLALFMILLPLPVALALEGDLRRRCEMFFFDDGVVS
jgi:hypothetical protein